jgi:hypothetical protein
VLRCGVRVHNRTPSVIVGLQPELERMLFVYLLSCLFICLLIVIVKLSIQPSCTVCFSYEIGESDDVPRGTKVRFNRFCYWVTDQKCILNRPHRSCCI